MKLAQTLVAAALLAACGTVLAESGNPEAGHRKSTPCQACHGPQGISVSPAFPNLAGQNVDYIMEALHQYKNGRRKNPIMQGQVANLSERDIGDLAAYFSGQHGLETKR
jgi:cytochrome c553